MQRGPDQCLRSLAGLYPNTGSGVGPGPAAGRPGTLEHGRPLESPVTHSSRPPARPSLAGPPVARCPLARRSSPSPSCQLAEPCLPGTRSSGSSVRHPRCRRHRRLRCRQRRHTAAAAVVGGAAAAARQPCDGNNGCSRCCCWCCYTAGPALLDRRCWWCAARRAHPGMSRDAVTPLDRWAAWKRLLWRRFKTGLVLREICHGRVDS